MNIGLILEKLTRLSDSRSYLIAYSGGIDSHVLLHVLAMLREQCEETLHLRALHVHHSLSPNADAWATHCERICHQYKIPFILEKVVIAPSSESLEAAARHERYRVLAKNLQEKECLLTAHTQDDQAETVLLQLLRGAGPKGLSAMPCKKPFVHSLHLRPLLSVTRDTICAYAKKNNLSWIEDESNENPRFDRNYLRRDVMPRLKKRWPAATQNIARSALHCAQTTALLAKIAQEDLFDLQGTQPKTLSVSRLLNLGFQRRANVLRQWFLENGLRAPTTQQLQQLDNDVLCCAVDASPVFVLDSYDLRRYRDDLYLVKKIEIDINFEVRWDCQSTLKLPGNLGELSPNDFSNFDRLTVRFRRGGERFKPMGSAHTQSLKTLLQRWGVPPWERDCIPLLFDGEKLIAVYGYCWAESATMDGFRGL